MRQTLPTCPFAAVPPPVRYRSPLPLQLRLLLVLPRLSSLVVTATIMLTAVAARTRQGRRAGRLRPSDRPTDGRTRQLCVVGNRYLDERSRSLPQRAWRHKTTAAATMATIDGEYRTAATAPSKISKASPSPPQLPPLPLQPALRDGEFGLYTSRRCSGEIDNTVSNACVKTRCRRSMWSTGRTKAKRRTVYALPAYTRIHSKALVMTRN